MKPIVSLLAFSISAMAPAQSFSSVTTQVIGAGCNVGSTGYCKNVGVPTTTAFTLDGANHALAIEVNLFEACGVTVPLRAVAVGFAPISVPLPDLGLGCELHVVPDLILTSATNPLRLSLPHGLPTLWLFTQAIALSLAPPGGQGSDGFTLSEGRLVSLQ